MFDWISAFLALDPLAFDFNFKNLSVVRKIKFIPFDYSKAGVYGSEDWKKLAGMEPELLKEFDDAVIKRESMK